MKHIKYLGLLFAFAAFNLSAENTVSDSLSYSNIMKEVIENYPALKKSEKDLVALDAKIGLSQTAYLPDINFNTSYARIGPTMSISMPVGGVSRTLKLFPENVYSAAVTVNQNIYDFGKTKKNVALDEQNKTYVQLNVEQAKQKISIAVAALYDGILFLQKAIDVRNEQLKNLEDHLTFVKKKADAGAATSYDALTTEVKISQIEIQITDLKTACLVQMAQLNAFLGRPAENPILLKQIATDKILVPSLDSLENKAFNNRPELKAARQKEEVAKAKLEVVNSQNLPSFGFQASGGFKNGYLNTALEDIGRMNFSVGVGFKVPIFDANRSKFQKVMTNAEIDGNKDESELTRRSIMSEVVESNSGVLASLRKVNQSLLQMKQAQMVCDMAETNYKAGSITHLDLMDAYTTLSDSKLALYKSKLDLDLNIQKLKISTGEKLY